MMMAPYMQDWNYTPTGQFIFENNKMQDNHPNDGYPAFYYLANYKLNFYDSYPLGFFVCQFQVSLHISSRVFVADHPSSSNALEESA